MLTITKLLLLLLMIYSMSLNVEPTNHSQKHSLVIDYCRRFGKLDLQKWNTDLVNNRRATTSKIVE